MADEHRDQDRGSHGGHPPERAAHDEVAQTERLRRPVFQHGLTAMRAGEHVGIRTEAGFSAPTWLKRTSVDAGERGADVGPDDRTGQLGERNDDLALKHGLKLSPGTPIP